MKRKTTLCLLTLVFVFAFCGCDKYGERYDADGKPYYWLEKVDKAAKPHIYGSTNGENRYGEEPFKPDSEYSVPYVLAVRGEVVSTQEVQLITPDILLCRDKGLILWKDYGGTFYTLVRLKITDIIWQEPGGSAEVGDKIKFQYPLSSYISYDDYENLNIAPGDDFVVCLIDCESGYSGEANVSHIDVPYIARNPVFDVLKNEGGMFTSPYFYRVYLGGDESDRSCELVKQTITGLFKKYRS